MNNNLHIAIKKEYEKKQKAAYDDMIFRRNKAFSAIPELEELVSRIQLAGVKYNKMILLGTSPADEAIAELQQHIDCLRNEKNRLLEEYGFAADFLEIIYNCPKCNDTGFIETMSGGEKCTCYKQQLINQLYLQSNLKLTEQDNFSVFNENYYINNVNESKYGIKISPRENILNIKERCLNFIENFDSASEKSLFFSGPTGVGKTFMSNCIAMELMNRGRTVLYQTAPSLFNTINEYKLKAYKDEDFEDSCYKSIYDVELLIIDDLGTESHTSARYAEFLTIIDTRKMNNLSKPCKTIISTNIGARELYEYYDERIASRIIGEFSFFKFAGEDIRSIKRMHGK